MGLFRRHLGMLRGTWTFPRETDFSQRKLVIPKHTHIYTQRDTQLISRSVIGINNRIKALFPTGSLLLISTQVNTRDQKKQHLGLRMTWQVCILPHFSHTCIFLINRILSSHDLHFLVFFQHTRWINTCPILFLISLIFSRRDTPSWVYF